MRILLTGASSFTGARFVHELASAGHEVVATFRGDAISEYTAVRGRRARGVARVARVELGCAFGTPRFLAVLRDARPEVVCHHGSDTSDYRSADFDAVAATARNTAGLGTVLDTLAAWGGRALVYTGSVFAGGHGAGSDRLEHVSPYGLSKALTGETLRYGTRRAGLAFGSFVIPNPFGPLEDPKFVAHLVRTWRSGAVPSVRTPDYVRDNIHVSLLARSYCAFVERVAMTPGEHELHPSGYVESQGAFAERVGRELAPRLGLPGPVRLERQTTFDEPRIRINTDPAVAQFPDWDETAAWTELAEFYAAEEGRSP